MRRPRLVEMAVQAVAAWAAAQVVRLRVLLVAQQGSGTTVVLARMSHLAPMVALVLAVAWALLAVRPLAQWQAMVAQEPQAITALPLRRWVMRGEAVEALTIPQALLAVHTGAVRVVTTLLRSMALVRYRILVLAEVAVLGYPMLHTVAVQAVRAWSSSDTSIRVPSNG